MRILLPVALAIFFSGTALANPLLTPEFWRTATPASLEQAIQAGAQVNARDPVGSTPLHFAAALSASPAIIETLARRGAEVNAREQRGSTPLHWAALANTNPAIIETLVRLGAQSARLGSRGCPSGRNMRV